MGYGTVHCSLRMVMPAMYVDASTTVQSHQPRAASTDPAAAASMVLLELN